MLLCGGAAHNAGAHFFPHYCGGLGFDNPNVCVCGSDNQRTFLLRAQCVRKPQIRAKISNLGRFWSSLLVVDKYRKKIVVPAAGLVIVILSFSLVSRRLEKEKYRAMYSIASVLCPNSIVVLRLGLGTIRNIVGAQRRGSVRLLHNM